MFTQIVGYFYFIIFLFFSTPTSYLIAGQNLEINLRVAAGQFKLQPNLKKNLEKIEDYLKRAKKNNVDLIVFPECALTGYPPRDTKTIDFVNQGKTEQALQQIQKRAKEFSIAIAIGIAWKDENNIWRNRAFFIDENGKILEFYDKIQQTSHERKFFIDGDRLPAFEWKGLKLGMLICMDMRYSELWRLMRKQNVNLMLHLAAAYGAEKWKRPVLEGTMRCRAAANGYFIVSCNNAGPLPMMTSAVYNPKGLILARANFANEEMIYYDIVVKGIGGFVDFHDNIYRLERVIKE